MALIAVHLDAGVILAVVHGLLGLLRVGLRGRATHSVFPFPFFPVPNKPSRFCGRKATCSLTKMIRVGSRLGLMVRR